MWSTITPFWLWTRAAYKFVYLTMPANHSIATGLLAATANATRAEREAYGLDKEGKEPVPGYYQGIPLPDGGVFPLANYNSFDYASDPFKPSPVSRCRRSKAWSKPPSGAKRGKADRNNPFGTHISAASAQFLEPDTDFYQQIAQCTGPSPNSRLIRVSISNALAWENQQEPQTETEKIYPILAVPDGFPFYIVQESPSNGRNSQYQVMRYGSCCAMSVPIEDGLDTGETYALLTRYDDRLYRRGWVLSGDIPALKQGKPVSLYSSAHDPRAIDGSLVPLTVGVEYCHLPDPGPPSVQPNMDTPDPLTTVREAVLDAHAWEDFPNTRLPVFQPPDWAKQPGAFTALVAYRFPPPNLLSLSEFDVSAQVSPFSQIADSHAIRCSFITLTQLLHTFPSSKHGAIGDVPVNTRPHLAEPWEIIKYDGHPYLRGWIEARVTQSHLDDQDLILAASPTDAEFLKPPVPVTIRMDRLGCQPLEAPNQQISLEMPIIPVKRLQLSNVHLDSHAWEPWQ